MKNVDHILNAAKQIITEELKKAGYDSEATYLFGSRSRGDFNKDSDWDFYIIVNKPIDFTEKNTLGARYA